MGTKRETLSHQDKAVVKSMCPGASLDLVSNPTLWPILCIRLRIRYLATFTTDSLICKMGTVIVVSVM